MVNKICVRPVRTALFKWDDTMALAPVSSPIYKGAFILSMRYSELDPPLAASAPVAELDRYVERR